MHTIWIFEDIRQWFEYEQGFIFEGPFCICLFDSFKCRSLKDRTPYSHLKNEECQGSRPQLPPPLTPTLPELAAASSAESSSISLEENSILFYEKKNPNTKKMNSNSKNKMNLYIYKYI